MKKTLLRTQGDPSLPTLIYLPGMHGHWSFAHALRKELKDKVRLVELSYPSVTTWDIRDYAISVLETLEEANIRQAWVLAESFGSQVAWELTAPETTLRIDGLILDGGFVKHPLPWGARFLAASLKRLPRLTGTFLGLLAVPFFRKIMRGVPLEDRLRFPFDKRNRVAMISRLHLIATNDPRPLASQTNIPVYFLTGLWDILVPFPQVWHWLKKNCPGYCHCKILVKADHATLMSQPAQTAAAILYWMGLSGK